MILPGVTGPSTAHNRAGLAASTTRLKPMGCCRPTTSTSQHPSWWSYCGRSKTKICCINRNVNDQNLVYQGYCPCFIPARSGCDGSSTGSSDNARHCLLRAQRDGTEGGDGCDPSWSHRGGRGASAHPQGHRDDFLPRLF